MKRCLKAAAIFAVLFLFVTGMALAQDKKTKSDRQKFGADDRIEASQKPKGQNQHRKTPLENGPSLVQGPAVL